MYGSYVNLVLPRTMLKSETSLWGMPLSSCNISQFFCTKNAGRVADFLYLWSIYLENTLSNWGGESRRRPIVFSPKCGIFFSDLPLKKKGSFVNNLSRPQVYDDYGSTDRVLRMIRSAQLLGDNRAIPEQLFELIGKIVVQPAVEMIILTDDDTYLLQKRSADDCGSFGAGLLHIPGGFLKPVPGPVSVLASAQWMASVELGVHHLDYIAGPLAVYRWPMETHEYANPISMLYGFQAQGIRTEGSGVVEFPMSALPKREEIICGHGGDVHYELLKIFQKAHGQNFQVPCIDLNMV